MANAQIQNRKAPPQTKGGFRINPVEMAIFAIVGMVFLNSLYSLFYEGPFGRNPVAQASKTKGMWNELKASSRTLASLDGVAKEGSAKESEAKTSSDFAVGQVPAFAQIKIDCEAKGARQVPASKVRLVGSFCGNPSPEHSKLLTHIEIVNKTSRYSATVFSDPKNPVFSTDYIPLNEGKNELEAAFTYKGGSTINKQFEIVRGPASK